MHIRADSYVYFLFNPKTNLIKIGYSMTPTFRRDDLNQEYKTSLEWLGVIPGSLDVERAYHGRFHDLWSHREWFHDDPEIRSEASKGVSELDYSLADGIRQIDRDMRDYITGHGYKMDKFFKGQILWQKQNLFKRLTEGKVTFEDWAHAYRPKDLSAQEGEGK